MPYPTKPHNLKVISGSRQPDPPGGVSFQLVDAVPDPPAWMKNDDALTEWARVTVILKANGLLTDVCLSMLAVLCAVYGTVAKAYAAGEEPTGHIVAQYRGLCNDFGISPVSQAKVRHGGEKAKENRFASNGKR